jgi:N-acetyl sugar amidotransferase
MSDSNFLWCRSCVLPNTRPNLKFYKGICNVCSNKKKNFKINWVKRKILFKKIIKKIKTRNKDNYDCLIPVSGGKDSTWQVIECLKFGLRPLTLTWRAPNRTFIGQKNLDNLISLGVDHIDYSINPKVESYFTLKSFKKFGAAGIPMHFGIFNLPRRIAAQLKIPLVIYGENSATEYGYDKLKDTGFYLDDNWTRKYGVNNGTTAKDWYDHKLNKKNMIAYDVGKNNFRSLSIFLGEFLKWDIQKSYKIAKKNGFKKIKKPKTGYYDFADIDDEMISIHHYLKLYKFGFTRLHDNLSQEIRNKRISRNKAISIIKKIKNKKPIEDIKKFCKFTKITQKEFFNICEKFRNKSIWKKNKGSWRLIKELI